jgi:hypothetical protein
MFYIVKRNDKFEIIEAERGVMRWYNAWGELTGFDYNGINDDYGKTFETRDIVKRSRAKTKEKVKRLYPQYFI